MDGRQGLTDEEVAWLRANRKTNQTATNLVSLYNMTVDCPSDPGARGMFAAALADWRQSRAALASDKPGDPA